MATTATTAADGDADVDNDNDDNDDDDDDDDDNLPPRVGKRNDGCNETKTEEEETRSQILWRYTQQSNRSQGGGVVDGEDYDDAYNKGSGHNNNDDDGR